jgi:hypothetical protein
MDRKRLTELLTSLQAGTIQTDDVVKQLVGTTGVRIPEAHIDLQRKLRTGHPEVVYGGHKTPQQVSAILSTLQAAGQDGLVTRATQEMADHILTTLPDTAWHPAARILHLRNTPAPTFTPQTPRIAVVCAGTSDLPVAEEAAICAEALGHPVDRYVDIGVAGLHRLLSRLTDLHRAHVIIVVAGMEGALPSVIAGLLPQPIIAVPTSVGYGSNLGGLAAMLGMLNSCASGVSVVNIDNGFGAALFASRILRSNHP